MSEFRRYRCSRPKNNLYQGIKIMSRLKLLLLLVIALLAAQSAHAMKNECLVGVPDGYNYQTVIHRTGWDEADYFSIQAWWAANRNHPNVIGWVRIRERYTFGGVAGAPVPEKYFPMTQYGPLPQERDWALPDPPQNVPIFLIGDLSTGAVNDFDHPEGGWDVFFTHSSANPCGVSATFNNTPPQISEAVLTSVVPANPAAAGRPANSFSVTSAVTSTTPTSDGKKALSWVCKKSDGTVLANATFELSNHQATPGSGGHIHTTGRPVGTFSALTGSAGADGVWTVGYTATEIGGTETFKAKCSAPNFVANASTWTAYIEVPGLVALSENPQLYEFVGRFADKHVENNFGTPAFNNVLVKLAFDFANKFPGELIRYNDMSLPFGGLFDFAATWTRGPQNNRQAHGSHRQGNDVDISHSNLTDKNVVYVRGVAASFKMQVIQEKPDNHTHLRLNH
jgi:hypothetical protein